MFRNIQTAFLSAIVITTVITMAAARMYLSAAQRSEQDGEETQASSPLGFDQLQYRRDDGGWRLSLDGVEKPYV